MNFADFCEFWCFSLGKQARFTLNFCSGMPPRKVHELTFFWFGLPGSLLKKGVRAGGTRGGEARFFRAFLNLWFGEPVVCTLDSRGFRHFRGFRDLRESSTELLVCSCLSCLRRFGRFRDFRRFRERRPAPKP